MMISLDVNAAIPLRSNAQEARRVNAVLKLRKAKLASTRLETGESPYQKGKRDLT
jgi:hypothetical protein